MRLLTLFIAMACFPALAAEIEMFSPRGEVKQVRQVAVRFSEDVVKFGDPRLADPFNIKCAAAGAGRWADARNWVYDFQKDLPAGLLCEFALKPEFVDLKGSALSGDRMFAFTTGGPAIRRALPGSGSRGIDEHQIFILALDAEATPASIEAHAWCEAEGVSEQIPLRVLKGDARKKVLDQRKLLGYEYLNLLVVRDEDGQVIGRGRAQTHHQLEQAERTLAVVQCRRTLPAGQGTSLVWGQGIATPGGVVTSAEQRMDFKVREDFIVRLSCERANRGADCLPMLPIRVEFTAPVARSLAEAIVLKGPQGMVRKPEPFKEKFVDAVSFAPQFPELTQFQVVLPKGLKDDAGRSPANADRFPLPFATDEAPPLAKFAGQFGILELQEGGVLPVSLRNLDGPQKGAVTVAGRSLRITRDEDIYDWMQRVHHSVNPEWGSGGRPQPGQDSILKDVSGASALPVIKPLGAREFEVAPIPLKEPGLYVVELESPKLGQVLNASNTPYYVPTMALVTDLAVHFQWGRESSSVWVTRLHDGSVVRGARVAIINSCTGATLWHGTTDGSGLAQLGADLPEPKRWLGCQPSAQPDLVISARQGADFSFALASWNEGIGPEDFRGVRSGLWGAAPTYAHTVLDRELYRAGETVSMKHYLREPSGAGFRIASFSPDKLIITHVGSNKSFELPLALDKSGIGENQWQIPKDAPLGNYMIDMVAGSERRRSTGFRVEQYKLPTSRAQIQPPKGPLIAVRSARLDLQVTYLSGGGASKLPVKLRTLVQPRAVTFKHYEEFRFGGEAVKEGLVEESQGGWFPEFGEEGEDEGAPPGGTPKPAQTTPVTLDEQGGARISTPLPAAKDAQELIAELEYSDPNGQVLTVDRHVPLWPSSINVGLATEGWMAASDDLDLKIVVLDTHGEPRADVHVDVDVFQREVHSYRKRLIGGFYGFANSRKTIRLPVRCGGETDSHGFLSCHLAPDVSGEVLVQARAADPAKRTARSVLSVWVAGKDDWWFSQQPNNRMDLLPEKKEYEPGENARFQVRMPFRTASALVTVEREGVLDQFVTELKGDKPIVEIPLKGNYAPNVYVSVLAVRGRASPAWLDKLAGAAASALAQLSGKSEDKSAEDPPPTALTDLGRPAFRLGVANISVGLKAHRLDVDVKPERFVYQIREKASVDVTVHGPDGEPARGAEIAIAAVDEALLELQPNHTWELLEAMMAPRPLSVLTATAQSQVVGKRQYGRKTVPPGGGGGRMSARELFDTLLLWRGRVRVDKEGHAKIVVPLNDALTSFRIVAVASRGIDQFGTGSASVQTHQDLQLTASLPQLVREGDNFRAGFSVRNATESPMHVAVAAKLQGQNLDPREADVPPGESRQVSWQTAVVAGTTSLAWDISASAGAAKDRLRTAQQVEPAFPVRVYQATLAQLDKPLQMDVQRPSDAVEGRGGIRVELMNRLGGSMDGVREYMSGYLWNCIEQRLSRAIVLDDTTLWESVKNDLLVYLDADGLLRYYPMGWLLGSDSLTAYALSITHEKGWEIPEPARSRMIEGLTGFVQGRVVRGNPLHREDQTERKLAALEALARYNKAQTDWVDALQFQPNLLPTSALLDWVGVLQRMQDVKDRDAKLGQALQMLRARINFQGTIMTFSTERDDAWWWLMASADRNANIAVLRVLGEASWQVDVPRLWRGAWERQKRGHWDTTLANAWGVLAAQRFAEKFEREPVRGSVKATLDGATQSKDWKEPTGQLNFAWPDKSGPLTVEQKGSGAPWAIVQSRAALPLKHPLSTGYRVQKSIAPVSAKGPAFTSGDLWRVTLEVEAQSDMTWVALEDPIPPGAMILGSGLGGDSSLLTRGEKREGSAWLAYEEKRQDSYRAYYEFVPKGTFRIEYTIRLNTPGQFQMPATRVEAMYAPEMFGELPNAPAAVAVP